MPGSGGLDHDRLVQFSGDITTDDGGRVTGRIVLANRRPLVFTAWLELVRLLEDAARQTERPQEGTVR
jgi:hypothetical protein